MSVAVEPINDNQHAAQFNLLLFHQIYKPYFSGESLSVSVLGFCYECWSTKNCLHRDVRDGAVHIRLIWSNKAQWGADKNYLVEILFCLRNIFLFRFLDKRTSLLLAFSDYILSVAFILIVPFTFVDVSFFPSLTPRPKPGVGWGLNGSTRT